MTNTAIVTQIMTVVLKITGKSEGGLLAGTTEHSASQREFLNKLFAFIGYTLDVP
jgi:hypothetical protein